jgi:hypothetical protein
MGAYHDLALGPILVLPAACRGVQVRATDAAGENLDINVVGPEGFRLELRTIRKASLKEMKLI